MILALFSDFDGTLVDIAQTPGAVKVGRELTDTLAGISKRKDIRLIIVTGRSLKDIKQRLPLKNVIYSGNHGLETEFCGKKAVFRNGAEYKKHIKTVSKALEKEICAIDGVFVENKGLTLSLHYRMAKKKDEKRIRDIFEKNASVFADKYNLKASYGKKVFEMRPDIPWDKGESVLFIKKKIEEKTSQKIYPVYIGDDLTDEDAFKAVNKMKGTSIFVGKNPGKTNARYKIDSPSNVIKFLKNLGGTYENGI